MRAAELKHANKTLDDLAYNLEVAKHALTVARNQVEAAEAALLEAVPSKLEGSLVTTASFYKITTTGKLTRTLDEKSLAVVRQRIPEAIFSRVIQFEPKLNLRDLRYVEDNEPDIYALFAEAITTKPAKTALKVERIATGE